MKSIFKFPYLAVLVVAMLAPLAVTWHVRDARAAVAMVSPQTCTPDQILACVNSAVLGVNNGAPTCTAAGCAPPASGPNVGAPPVISLTCSTAGGGTSSMGAGSNNFQGRVTCTSTANTTATLTWATARTNQPTCVVVGETTPVLVIGTNSLTALSWTYASTVSPIFDYTCWGQ